MASGPVCVCAGSTKERRKNWVVRRYKYHNSAFAGYHPTSSDYSSVQCTACERTWRTKASYVHDLKIVPYV